MSIWYHTNDQPPYPEKQKLRYGSHAYESPSRSAQSDSFQVCTEEYGIERYYPYISQTAASKRYSYRQFAIRHDKKVPITRQRFHCSVGVTILTNMVAGHTGTDPFPASAVFWLVDPAKSGFILEHKADFPGVVDKLKFLYCGVILNFN